jgi:drug/metabolite transporter (DMT)-like permease
MAAAAAILFGASVVATRIAVREISPLTLACLRFGQGSVLVLATLALLRRQLLRIDRRDLPHLALLGALFYTIFPVAFNAGVRYIPASRAALILATMPLFTLVLARSIARERLSARQLAGVMISIAGVAVVMADRGAVDARSTMGDVLLVATSVCGAIYNVLAKRALARYAGMTVTAYAMTIGTVLLVPALLGEPPFSVHALRPETISAVLFLGSLGGGLAFSLWTSALRRLSPTQVAVYINLNPLAATLLAATMLHERLSAWFAAGFVAVASGLMIVNWTPRSVVQAPPLPSIDV